MRLPALLLLLFLSLSAEKGLSITSNTADDQIFYLLFSEAKPVQGVSLKRIEFHPKKTGTFRPPNIIPVTVFGAFEENDTSLVIGGEPVALHEAGTFKHSTVAVFEGENLVIPVLAVKVFEEPSEAFIKILVPRSFIEPLVAGNLEAGQVYSLNSGFSIDAPSTLKPLQISREVPRMFAEEEQGMGYRSPRDIHFTASTAIISSTETLRLAPIVFFSIFSGLAMERLELLKWELRLGLSSGENADSSQAYISSFAAFLHFDFWAGLNLSAGSGIDYWFTTPGKVYASPALALSYFFYRDRFLSVERIFFEYLRVLAAEKNSHQVALGVSFRI